jgi:hypothetical protein
MQLDGSVPPAMQLDGSATPATTLRVWRDWISVSMSALAEGKASLLPRPTLPTGDAVARIAGQIELMAGASQRLAV